MPAANVQLIVRHVSAGNEIGNHRQAVSAIRAGRRGNLRAIDNARGGSRFGDDGIFLLGDFDGLRD